MANSDNIVTSPLSFAGIEPVRFEPVAEGVYLCQISAWTIKTSKNSGQPMVEARLQIKNGTYAGRQIFWYMSLSHEAGKDGVAPISRAVGIITDVLGVSISDLQEHQLEEAFWIGLGLKAKVVQESQTKTMEDDHGNVSEEITVVNRVKSVYKLSEVDMKNLVD